MPKIAAPSPPGPSSIATALRTLWLFTRPHTIIGSTFSIISLYFLAWGLTPASSFQPILLGLSLLSALACNVYITGLNQWADVDVDRINKPWLPIPAGLLSLGQAQTIVILAGILALAAAAALQLYFAGLIALIMAIGTAYSLPPLKFKRSHILAAAAIAGVRGVLVNLGFILHFHYALTGSLSIPPAIWPLTIFVAAFSIGIAWFKDIPDTVGDAAYDFGTLAVKTSRSWAFNAGVIMVSSAYLLVMLAAWLGFFPQRNFYLISHGAVLLLFWWQAWRLNVEEDRQVKRFYLFFWGLFFLEYLLYPWGFWW